MSADPHDLLTTDDLHTVDLDLQPNEASGLVSVRHRPLLEAHGWAFGFWTVLDEGRIEHCLALIGRDAQAEQPTDGWEIRRLHGRVAGDTGKTADAEAIAEHDGWVYAFGSLFGSKSGPLDLERQFVCRFREGDVEHDPKADVELEVIRDDFRLHSLINDALWEFGVDGIVLGPRVHKRFITKTRRKAIKQQRSWAHRIRWDDLPINAEGATFRPDGSLLLGLRFPVTVDGQPLIVQIEGIERLFEGDGEPDVTGVWVLGTMGSRRELLGVRDLQSDGDQLHVLAGSVDSGGKGSVLLSDHPEGAGAACQHWRVTLPQDRQGGWLEPELVRTFPDLDRVEGLAVVDGSYYYVSDEDERVLTRFAKAAAS